MLDNETTNRGTLYSFYPVEFGYFDENELELRRLIELIRERIEYDWISCFVRDPLDSSLTEIELEEKGFNLIESIRFSGGQGLAAWVAEQQRPILLSAVHKSQRFRSNPVKSFICCPVIRDGETIGVINLGHTKVNAYGKKTLNALLDIVNGEGA